MGFKRKPDHFANSQELEDLLDDDEDMLSMYLARKEMSKLAAEQAAKASQAEQDRNDSDEDGTTTEEEEEEEGGDLFPISPIHNKNKTPFSGQGAFLLMPSAFGKYF